MVSISRISDGGKGNSLADSLIQSGKEMFSVVVPGSNRGDPSGAEVP